MASSNVNYRTLNECNQQQQQQQQHKIMTEGHDYEAANEVEDTPRSSGVLLHTVPEINRARWNHIEDLDSFFTRMYHYHQKHGFLIIVLEEFFQLIEFAFVIWLLTFSVHCVRHDILFGHALPKDNHTKITISDVIIPMDKCVDNFNGVTYTTLFVSALYLLIRTIKVLYHITQYWDIKKFYNTALYIEDANLDNITWHEIKKKVREVQAEQHMCIDKDHLTDLDIYHRILRFKNYLVALMNKNLLPVRFTLPIVGEVVTLSRGLLFNIDLILFRSPGSPFQNNWQLHDDYSVRGNQVELANRLSKLILWIAIANFIFAPVIFVWQLLYFSFTYANVLKKEPGALGMRTWSNYGRLYLRHFNELDHELDARLNRSYDYADRYLNSFSSPLLAVIARNILFISGGMLLTLLALGIYDEYVFQVEHILTIVTLLSAVGLLCRNLIPNENLIWCPEQLMTAILAHVHYLPPTWKNKAHTSQVRNEFGNFFQFKANYFLNEILSPIVTPFQLLFVFRPKALEIVKFFRSFTVSVRGVGNVCSFAQMDVRKYGNTAWQLDDMSSVHSEEPQVEHQVQPDDNGKTELSLLRFTLTNPEWQMSPHALHFVNGVRQNALADLSKLKKKEFTLNPLTESLISFGTIGNEYSSIARSLLHLHNVRPEETHHLNKCQNQNHCQCYFEQMLQQGLGEHSRFIDNMTASRRLMSQSLRKDGNMKILGVSKLEGSLAGPSQSLITSLYGPETDCYEKPSDLTVADMCLSVLYLHELRHQRQDSSQFHQHQSHHQHPQPSTIASDTVIRPEVASTDTIVTTNASASSAGAAETTPLLGIRS